MVSVSRDFSAKDSLLKLDPDKIVDKPEDLLDFFGGEKALNKLRT